jgi:hypothetical protein
LVILDAKSKSEVYDVLACALVCSILSFRMRSGKKKKQPVRRTPFTIGMEKSEHWSGSKRESHFGGAILSIPHSIH